MSKLSRVVVTAPAFPAALLPTNCSCGYLWLGICLSPGSRPIFQLFTVDFGLDIALAELGDFRTLG